MSNNPWSEIPSRAPLILPGDMEAIERFNANPKRKDIHRVQLDILPEPFVGSKDAPVLLLSNNPGYAKRAFHKLESTFIDRMRANLHHQPSEYPFVYIDPTLCEPLRKWWTPKLKHLRGLFGEEVVARSILNVTYFPYASNRFKHGKLVLDSQQYGFYLVREAMKRNAVIVLFRSGKRWFKAVEGLEKYARLYRVKNFQNPTLSPKNLSSITSGVKDCQPFEIIVNAIQTAEQKRRDPDA